MFGLGLRTEIIAIAVGQLLLDKLRIILRQLIQTQTCLTRIVDMKVSWLLLNIVVKARRLVTGIHCLLRRVIGPGII